MSADIGALPAMILAALLLAGLWALTRLPARGALAPTPPLPPGAPLWPRPDSGPDSGPVSGVAALPDGIDAFAARVALCRAARIEICAQYYMWRGDHAGTLLHDELLAAAARGVRVRLLLDDNATAGLDDRLAWLDSHENVAVRLFNPFRRRAPRLLGFLFHFARLNRRMHNKALIVDGVAAIVGGRNIGDEYYNDLSQIGLFMDMDVLVDGAAAGAAQADFDRYWAAEPAWPVARLVRPRPARAAARHLAALAAARETRFAGLLAARLEAPLPALHGAEVRLLSDPPEKVLGRAKRRHLLYPSLRMALGTPTRNYDVISPYFVPRRRDSRHLAALARAGLRVRVLTNALAASDTPIVHSGYGWKRRALLRAGVEIYEYQGEGRLRLRRGLLRRGTSPFARNKLHAKILSVDRARVFIGTFNFDPRSLFLNTEMGVVIDDPAWAEELHRTFDATVPHSAWRVMLTGGRLRWRMGARIMRHEPGTRLWQRALIAALSLLPIEGLL